MNPENEKPQLDFLQYKQRVESFLNKYLVEKLPSLPLNIKEGVVNNANFLIVIIAIFTFILLVSALFSVAFVASISATKNDSFTAIRALISLGLLIPVIYFEIKSLPNLSRRMKYQGWNYLMYAFLLDILYTIVVFNPIGFVIRIIFLYTLFQVRSYYSDENITQ